MRVSELAVMFALAMGSGQGVAGGMSSVGGDYVDDGDNPWFMGTQPVPYCVERTEMFSVPADVLSRLVADAFDAWNDADTQLTLFGGVHMFPDGVDRQIATHFSLVENCSQARLQILFGVPLGEAGEPSYAVARAERESLNRTTGSTALGRIAFAPDIGAGRVAETPERMWSMQYGEPALYNIVLHELGHTLGISHRIYRNPAEAMVRGLLTRPNGRPMEIERTSLSKALSYIDPVVGWQRKGNWLLSFAQTDLEDALGIDIPSVDPGIFFTVHAIERRTTNELLVSALLTDQHGWRMPITAKVTVTRSSSSAPRTPVSAQYFNPGGGVFNAVQYEGFGRLYYGQTSFSGTLMHDQSAKAVDAVLTLGGGTMIALGLQTRTGIVYCNSY